jgi:diaminopimelate decarboxylase
MERRVMSMAATAWNRRLAGRLAPGGIDVERLAARVGSTPFFAYDRQSIQRRIEAVRAALPPDVGLNYAVKANPMPALLQHLSGRVDGFDVASGAELRQAIAAGVTVELESEQELARIRSASAELGIPARIALRVNPDFTVRGSAMRLGGGPQQFGIDAERVPALLRTLTDPCLDFQGFHVFAGSQNLRAESICEAQLRTVEMVLNFLDSTPAPVRYLNLGGGFGIPYSSRDQPLDLDLVGKNLAILMAELIRPKLPGVRVVLELGRYLVGEAGVYLTRVVDRKQSRGKTFLVVDGGMHHQLAASGNLGQAIRRNYPIAVANRLDEPVTETVTVVGSLCTPLDLLGADVELPVAQVGDLIAVFQAGAYGLTASPTGFLSHPAPVEVLV